MHFRSLLWYQTQIQGGTFLEPHPTPRYSDRKVENQLEIPKWMLFRGVPLPFRDSARGGVGEKKSSTQFWLLMIHKKEVFAKNRSARSRGVGRPYLSSKWVSQSLPPPRHLILAPRHLILAPPSPHRDLRICSLHAIGWCQEFSKVSKRTHLHRKPHENASNKCNIDAFWCSFCSLLTGRGSSPGQPSAQIQMVPRWLRTGFGVSSASNTI